MDHQVGSFQSKKVAFRFVSTFGDLFKVPLVIKENLNQGALVRRFDVSLNETIFAESSGMGHLSIFPHYFDSLLVTLRASALSMNARKEIKRLKKKFPKRFPIK